MEHTLKSVPDWNENAVTVTHGTNELFVSIHKYGDDPDCGETIRISVDDFINLARAVSIVESQKLPPKAKADQ